MPRNGIRGSPFVWGSPLSQPQLSIVIPALGSLDLLEATLVSVLQNRPRDCEVVVVLNQRYDDPYSLSGEVRFLEAREAHSLAEALQAATKVCRGLIVHVLAAGVEVDEGWTDFALEHFCDHRIAAVAPLVLKSREEQSICSAGVEYSAGGRRRAVSHGDFLEDIQGTVVDALGPSQIAAFYRREALAKLPQPFDPTVGDRLLDVDTALQLKQAGYRAVFEPRSIAYRQAASLPKTSAFAAGRQAERLFWRNTPVVGKVKALVTHPFVLAAELFESRSLSEKIGRLLGRFVALFEAISYRRHHRELAAVGKPGLAFAVVSTGDRIRVDGAHPHPTTAGKPKKTADHRLEGGTGHAA